MYFLQTVRHVIRFLLFWLALSWLDRSVFILIFSDQLGDQPIQTLGQIFIHSLRLDLSMAAYATAIPYVMWSWNSVMPAWSIPRWVFKSYVAILLLLCIIFTASNLIIYKEWSEKFSFKAMDLFLGSPREALASVSLGFVIGTCIGIILVSIGLFLLSKKWNRKAFVLPRSQPSKWIQVPFLILGAGLLFLAIRGGVSRSPINPSMAYYSETPFFNHAATNTYWYLIDDMVHARSSRHPYLFMEKEEAENYLKAFFNKNSSNTSIESLSKVPQPNVVMVLLEGFTAHLLKEYGGDPEIAPHMQRLMKEGLWFSNLYATAERSDKGVIGLLSAFPAQASQSVIQSANKQEKLPSLAQDFKAKGYTTSFYYGGQSEFYNLKSYVLTHQYDELIDIQSFDKNTLKSSWGVYDQFLIDRWINDHNHAKEPFFSTIYTLTNHHPFELPGSYTFGKENEANKFKSTAHYTDSVINEFIRQVHEFSWFENTLFVFVADHGHRLPDNERPIYEPSRHLIPFFIWGPALNDSLKSREVNIIGSQTDVAATLLQGLNGSSVNYPWSRNLLDPQTKGLAFFNWKDGFGILTEEGKAAFDLTGRHLIKQENPSDSARVQQELLPVGKAILQEVYRAYLTY